MTGYFSVRNFEKFQHYKDRNPPWIRLYNSLLDSYEYGKLPDASKAHLLAIFLLASRSSNKIAADLGWLKSALHATEEVDLMPLLNGDFIVMDEDCSKMLAEREQNATQRRGENIRKKPYASAYPPLTGLDEISLAVESWNRTAKALGLATVQRLTDQRKRSLTMRLKEGGGLAGWDAALGRIQKSPFLLNSDGNNRSNWQIDFDSIITSKIFTKLSEGGYENGRVNGNGSHKLAKPTSIDKFRKVYTDAGFEPPDLKS